MDPSADLPRPPVPEATPPRQTGLIARLRDAERRNAQGEVKEVEREIKGRFREINIQVPQVTEQWRDRLKLKDSREERHEDKGTIWILEDMSGTFVGPSGEDLDFRLLSNDIKPDLENLDSFLATHPRFGKTIALILQDPDDPNASVMIQHAAGNLDDEGSASFFIGTDKPARDQKSISVTSLPFSIDVYGEEEMPDPLDAAQRGLDFLKTATLKPAETEGQTPPAPTAPPAPPTPPTQTAPSV